MRRILLVTLCAFGLAACSGAGRDSVAPVYPVVPSAPYADALKPCARAFGRQGSCTMRQLPPLGVAVPQPAIADILGRTAVTHPWMGERFAELLAQMPPEILELCRSVSAIIIGSDVRPSFYWGLTGAIYLDPAGLWLTLEEKRTIDPAPDYRGGFGAALNYYVLARYVRNNQYAWYGYSLEDDSERSLDDIVAPMARLLFHELAHANDFLPPEFLDELDPAMTYDAIAWWTESQQRQPSQQLQGDIPLQSQTMFDLARVNFFGRDPSSAQLALQPADITAEFAPDRANDDYNYSTRYEDLAMLFEEVMMDYAFGIRRDVAVTNRPQEGAAYVVDWGQRGRIGDDALRPRVELVLSRLLPERDFSAYLASLPPPEPLRSGASWNDNLNPSGQAKSSLRGQLQPREYDEVRR